MKGVNVRVPPKPRYCVIWDVQMVLDNLRTMRDEDLSLKSLTRKTAMTLALVTLSRCSDLKNLDLAFLAESDSKLIFHFGTPPKHWRKAGTLPKPVEILASGMELCPVKVTKNYIARTASLRGSHTKLFIGCVAPHKPVTGPTIGNWIKVVLESSGIDTTAFKGHSTRSASSSQVFAKGASVSDILSRGQWSNADTWQKFYNKRIISANKRFQNSLLNKGS
jgi:hypothetical protein